MLIALPASAHARGYEIYSRPGSISLDSPAILETLDSFPGASERERGFRCDSKVYEEAENLGIFRHQVDLDGRPKPKGYEVAR